MTCLIVGKSIIPQYAVIRLSAAAISSDMVILVDADRRLRLNDRKEVTRFFNVFTKREIQT